MPRHGGGTGGSGHKHHVSKRGSRVKRSDKVYGISMPGLEELRNKQNRQAARETGAVPGPSRKRGERS